MIDFVVIQREEQHYVRSFLFQLGERSGKSTPFFSFFHHKF
jgi:hypothetical protein